MNKIKVLEAMDVYLPDVDGVINCMHNYCLNLNEKAELTVAVPKNKRNYVDNQPYKISRCKSLHIPILNDYYGFPAFDKKFKKAIMEKNYDIIHVHSPFNMARFALKVSKKKNIPIVATFHSNMRPIFIQTVKSKFIAELMVRRLGRLYNKFDEVFVCSELVANQVRSFGYKGKISYLPFGTDFVRCENVEELRQKANDEFNIDKNELVFIYVGRVMKLKRIDFILRSLKMVKEKGKKFKFYIVGKGADFNKLKNLKNELGFTDDEVIFTGFLKRELFPLIFARSDLLLFPSIYDNFGLVKVEAAAYQTPGLFIANSCAGDGVIDEVNGYLSENNEKAFAEKIEKIIEDPEKLSEVGKNAGRDIYINWSECTNRLLEKLTEIVERRKSANKK